MDDIGPWTTAVTPIVKKCEVAVAFNSSVTFNTKGADALGKVLKNMARLLDKEIEKLTKEEKKP